MKEICFRGDFKVDEVMLKKNISLKAIENSAIHEISKISRECKSSHWKEEDYIDELKRNDSFNICCVTNHPTQYLGFLFARLIIQINTDYSHKNLLKFEEAEILNIAVSPGHQGTGIGQIIFDYFFKFCINKQISVIWLEVRKSNRQAQNFYSKNKFQIVCARKNYYQNPAEDALVMKLDLASD